ncbi:Regulatory protein, LysR:LysR, substrate-binding [Xenorhabdus nematophila F1]|uniref:Regulatory protein, LysR:LysR, substrate-binding n=1 Tax=Xenorhabdus nematophila (strain ATCC 19061 / DSM 3370 / CCUG 14189 / LMG 1036 / NCIMB 9965 / AN6) TaxID=406817 RepID=D3VFK7_XENNA
MSLLTSMKPTHFRQITGFYLKLLRIFKTVVEYGRFSAAKSLIE